MKKLITVLILCMTLSCSDNDLVLEAPVEIEVLNPDGSIPDDAYFKLTNKDNKTDTITSNGSNLFYHKSVKVGHYDIDISNETHTFKDCIIVNKAIVKKFYFKEKKD